MLKQEMTLSICTRIIVDVKKSTGQADAVARLAVLFAKSVKLVTSS
jgi:tellurite resistance protein